MTQAYTTELTLEQYELLASLLPPETATGRSRTVNMMSVIQGILYILVSSSAWRLMPMVKVVASMLIMSVYLLFQRLLSTIAMIRLMLWRLA